MLGRPVAERDTPIAKGYAPNVIAMELVGVRVEVPANTPVVILREQPEPHRVLPILIGSPEASAIHTALSGIVAPRPMTHDLIVELLRSTEATLDKVVVTEIRDHTFYAELHLRVRGSESIVSCRPSDAIAVACRTGATIYAEESLLEEVGLVAADGLADDEPEDEAILDEFRDFLDEIKPEDFEA
jgi:bifunctional DNase/RNase